MKPLFPNGFKYTYEPAPLKGESGNFEFEGKVGFEMEVRIKDQRHEIPSQVLVYVGAAAVALGGVLIIVGDTGKDALFLPGTAESPLSWAAAMALFARASAMVGTPAAISAP